MERLFPEKITDEDNWIRSYNDIINILLKENIRHGDLTLYNVFPKNNKPILIDFNESRYYNENLHDKRKEDDSHWLWRTMIHYLDITSYPPTKNSRAPEMWWAMKPYVCSNSIKSVIDLGCGMGDISIRCLMNGKSVKMVDSNKEQLDIGRSKIQELSKGGLNTTVEYCESTISDFIKLGNYSDGMICFSVLPYLSDTEVSDVLNYMKSHSKISFVEIQSKDDGPGKLSEEQIFDLLEGHGFSKIENIGSTLVDYRNKKRIIWKLT
jgi:2-polyprenyl-3-methyl-5-hydroxy-6-metoxy-1,4-benzoquinol methylase